MGPEQAGGQQALPSRRVTDGAQAGEPRAHGLVSGWRVAWRGRACADCQPGALACARAWAAGPARCRCSARRRAAGAWSGGRASSRADGGWPARANGCWRRARARTCVRAWVTGPARGRSGTRADGARSGGRAGSRADGGWPGAIERARVAGRAPCGSAWAAGPARCRRTPARGRCVVRRARRLASRWRVAGQGRTGGVAWRARTCVRAWVTGPARWCSRTRADGAPSGGRAGSRAARR